LFFCVPFVKLCDPIAQIEENLLHVETTSKKKNIVSYIALRREIYFEPETTKMDRELEVSHIEIPQYFILYSNRYKITSVSHTLLPSAGSIRRGGEKWANGTKTQPSPCTNDRQTKMT
jgi:hypothetical protein